MSGTGSRPFVSDRILRSARLGGAWSSLAALDAVHVADVHGQQGVVEGLILAVDDGDLTVAPGRAYTACGDLVPLAAEVRFAPDRPVGPYAVWLRPDGRVDVRPASADRPPFAVHLGSARIVAGNAGARTSDTWTVDRVVRPVRVLTKEPYVASGRMAFDVSGIELDAKAQALRVRVDTSSGGFESTPLYVATLAAEPSPLFPASNLPPWFAALFRPRGRVGGGITWYSTICETSADSFVLRLHLLWLTDVNFWFELGDRLGPRITDVPDGLNQMLAFVVFWMGVDTRRPGAGPLDMGICEPPPAPPAPEPPVPN